jgi:signal transduction histidine kinase
VNSLLARQLRRFGLTADRLPDDLDAWREMLASVERSYDDNDRSRYLLERSLQISSEEMRSIHEELSRVSAATEAEQESRLRAVIDSLDDGLCVLGRDGSVEFANAAATRLLEEPDLMGAEPLGRFRFWAAEGTGLVEPEAVLEAVWQGGSFTDDTATLERGNESLAVSVAITPITVDDAVVGLVFVFRDLTDHHRMLDAIRRTESHYRNLFHSIPIAVYEEDYTAVGEWLEGLRRQGVDDLDAYLDDHTEELLNAIGRIEVRDVNPAAVALVGAESAAQLLGPLGAETFTEETLASMRQQLLAIWEGTPSIQLELTGSTLQGNRLDAIFHWTAGVSGRELDLSRVLVALADITERKHIEEQLADLVRSKDALIAAVSHEIRTPLTAVYTGAEVLLEQWESLDRAERVSLVADIASEGRELTDIVEDLLVAARANEGVLRVSMQRVDLRKEVSAVLDAVRTVEGAVDIDVSGVTGFALADPLRFRQIVRNLLSNALRYGGPTVAVQCRVVGDRVRVLVTDDGEGVPEEQRDRVFDAYHGALTRAGVPASVGLGLTVSRCLAEAMGGSLDYRRERGLTMFELDVAVAPSTRTTLARDHTGIPAGR